MQRSGPGLPVPALQADDRWWVGRGLRVMWATQICAECHITDPQHVLGPAGAHGCQVRVAFTWYHMVQWNGKYHLSCVERPAQALGPPSVGHAPNHISWSHTSAMGDWPTKLWSSQWGCWCQKRESQRKAKVLRILLYLYCLVPWSCMTWSSLGQTGGDWVP